MKTLLITAIFLFLFFLLVGMLKTVKAKTETQKYETLYSDGKFEIRFYPQAILASVTMDGNYDNSRNSGFRILAGYIFGGNQENQKIAMTSPVRMSNQTGSNTMSFVLPSGMQFDKLPTPNNERILLHKSQPVYAAVVRYGGYTNGREIEKKKNELINELEKRRISYKDNFEYLGYNAPFDMFNRRNEVWVELYNFDPVELKKLTAKR